MRGTMPREFQSKQRQTLDMVLTAAKYAAEDEIERRKAELERANATGEDACIADVDAIEKLLRLVHAIKEVHLQQW